jgi:heme/copper-type cytochrome/quinol oxidase subunit 2
MVASRAVSDQAREDTQPLAAAIYGAVQATALVAAFSEDEHLSSLELDAWLAITVLVFWLAHGYAAVLAQGYARRRGLSRAEVLAQLSGEWRMVQAAIPPAIVLVLGALHVFSKATAVSIAIGVGLAQLFLWALAARRREGLTGMRLLTSALIAGSFGVVIVSIKAAVG